MDTPVVVALIAAGVTVIGWFVAKAREARARRIEYTLRQLERQIEEFYGPIYSLIHQIFTTWEVKHAILDDQRYSDRRHLSAEQRAQVTAYFQQKYFFPLHEAIRGTLRTKLHLVTGGEPPASFQEYLRHATQQVCQHAVWTDLHIGTEYVDYTPWPTTFYDDIREGLLEVIRRHEQCVRDLAEPGVYRAAPARGHETAEPPD